MARRKGNSACGFSCRMNVFIVLSSLRFHPKCPTCVSCCQRNQQIQQHENRLKQRELSLNQRQDDLNRKKGEIETDRKRLENQQQGLARREEELKELEAKEREKLEAISGLSADEARERLVESLKDEAKTNAASYINEIMDEAKLTANKEAKRLLKIA